MKITMWMRPSQLESYRIDGIGYASTCRDHDMCFQIEVDESQVSLERVSGIPSYNYKVSKTKFD